MLHSAFADRYKGVYFKISFHNHENGWTTELEIEGLPPIRDRDNLWKTKEAAHDATMSHAHRMIDGQ